MRFGFDQGLRATDRVGVRAAGGVEACRELSAARWADPAATRARDLTTRRVVDLARTASMICRVWIPGH